MANVIYVGNYSHELSDEDIMAIFEDFEGLELLRSLRRNRKCYSFILCQNQEQVIEIVFSFNGIDVGGRKLIVRASDDELQEMIDQCGDDDDYINYDNHVIRDEDEEILSSSEKYSGTQTSKSNYRQPRKPSRLASAKVIIDSFSTESIEAMNSKKDVSRKRSETRDIESPCSEASCSETASFRSYSPCSVASSYQRKERKEKFSFVSIVNFPNGTTTEELEELFSEFRPFKIIIQNQVAEDDRPTEAAICFLKNKDATNSIISLDNTLYRGRVVLVTECDDISLISDLIKVNYR